MTMIARLQRSAMTLFIAGAMVQGIVQGSAKSVFAQAPSVEPGQSKNESLSTGSSELALNEKPNPDKWEFEFSPYLWMSSIRSDVSAGPISLESDVCFTDLLKDLDMGAMMRFEGRKDRWGFYVEGMYLGLGDDSRAKIGPFRVRGLETDFRLTQVELDFGGMYRFGESDRSFDLMLGGRYTHMGTDVSVGPLIDSKSNIDFVAPVAGGRFQLNLSDKWLFSLKADVGGFGIGEAPDFSWGATAILGYRLSPTATLGFGYRYYDIHNAEGAVDMDLKLYGPLVGVAFKF